MILKAVRGSGHVCMWAIVCALITPVAAHAQRKRGDLPEWLDVGKMDPAKLKEAAEREAAMRVSQTNATPTLQSSFTDTDCQRAFAREVAAARSAGDTDVVNELEALPAIPIYDYSNNLVCHIRIDGDIRFDTFGAIKASAISTWPDGRERIWEDEKGQTVTEERYKPVFIIRDARAPKTWKYDNPPADSDYDHLDSNNRKLTEIREHLANYVGIHRVRQLSFADIKIGMSLDQVFATLARQGYAEEDASYGKSVPFIWNARYKFAIECDKVWDKNQEHDISMCDLNTGWGGMKFSRKDAQGTLYKLELSFTPLSTPLRADALSNAKVSRINGSVSVKADVGKEYYDNLAKSKYGDTLQFFTSNLSDRDRDLYSINPGPSSLSVEIKSDSYYNEARDQLSHRLIATEKSNASTAPKPVF